MVPNLPKLPYKSKTILFSLLALVIAIAVFFGFDAFVMPPEIKEWYDVLLPVIFMGLRLVTKAPVSMSPGDGAKKA